MDAASLVESEAPEPDSSVEDLQSSPSLPLLASTESPAPHLAVSQDRTRIGWHLLLTTLVLVTLSAGFGIALLIWVTYVHGVPTIDGKSILTGAIRSGAFIVDEGTTAEQDSPQTATLFVLTFSSITTQVVSLTAPLLVMMAAYCTVGSWLSEQEQLTNYGEGLPTPAQFGILVKLSSTAGIVSIYETTKYLITGALQKRRESAPAMFYTTTISVVAIYSVTHLISGADFWLHLSSSAVFWDTPVPISSAILDFSRPLPPDAYPLGFTFNDTLCTNLDNGYPCLMETFTGSESTWIGVVGTWITQNQSFVNQVPASQPNPRVPVSVITLHEESDLAVIVPSPGTYDSSLTWTAASYGLRTSCRSMTDACKSNHTGGGIISDCTSAGYPGFPLKTGLVYNIAFRSSNGSEVDASEVVDYYAQGGQLHNPYDIQLGFDLSNGIANPPISGLVNMYEQAFLACAVTFFNVTLRHNTDDTYTTVDGTMVNSSDAFAAIMSGPLWGTGYMQAMFSAYEMATQGASEASTIAVLNQQISSGSLGQFAATVIPVPAFTVAKPTLLSRYPTPPLLVYVSLLFLYSALVLGVFTWASTITSRVVRARDGTETTSLKLGQALLTDPLTLVGLALPQTLDGVNETSLLKKPVEMFGEIGEGDHDFMNEQGGKLRRRAPRLVYSVLDEGPRAGKMLGVREWKRDN